MSLILNFEEFLNKRNPQKNKEKLYDEGDEVLPIEDIEDVSLVGRTFSYDDYYRLNTVAYPNYEIKKKKDGKNS